MPFKNQYITQSPFAIGRSMLRRITPFAAEAKPFKTQNRSRDSFGRMLSLNTKAAKSSVTINGAIPSFKNIDPNFVNLKLLMARR